MTAPIAVKLLAVDPSRVILLDGPLDRQRGADLIVQLRRLSRQSREPIALDIRSTGGVVHAFYNAVDVFYGAAPEGCEVITIARDTRSAAAFLAVAGDRAYACRDTFLSFHGARARGRNQRNLRSEHALAVGLQLDRENRKIAKRMARPMASRLLGRFGAAGLHHDTRDPRATIQDFASYLDKQVVAFASSKVIEEAAARFPLIHHLVAMPKVSKSASNSALEIDMVHAALAFDSDPSRQQDADARPLDPVRLVGLAMDYALARDIVRGGRAAVPEKLAEACREQWPTSSAGDAYATAFWCFSMTVCYRLLLGENRIPAEDAYWLGLVDEVVDLQVSVDGP